MRKTALIVENDLESRNAVGLSLFSVGIDSVFAENESVMWRQLAANPDVVILDISQPNVNGLEVLRQLRRQSDIPVLIRSTRSDEIERIVGIEIGADDFMPKPCNMRELVARVRGMLRRIHRKPGAHSPESSFLYFGTWTLNNASRELSKPNGQRDSLGAPGFALLSAFLQHPFETLSREHLLSVLNREYDPTDRIVDVYVSQIRNTLGKQEDGKNYIKTLRSQGYVFIAPVSLQAAQ